MIEHAKTPVNPPEVPFNNPPYPPRGNFNMLSRVLSTVISGGPGLILPPDDRTMVVRVDNQRNHYSPCQMYQKILVEWDADIIIYAHDDLTIHDADWQKCLISLFDNPKCVAAGFGGALGLGNRDLYRKPYSIWNMARSGYGSNQTDWSTHGERIQVQRRVAVLDAFLMAVRRDFILCCGGWPVDRLTHHCLDLWLACAAARAGKEIWQTGVSCTHHGGGTSTKPGYTNAPWLQGGSLELDHQMPHRWLFEEYRDVLPLEVE